MSEPSGEFVVDAVGRKRHVARAGDDQYAQGQELAPAEQPLVSLRRLAAEIAWELDEPECQSEADREGGSRQSADDANGVAVRLQPAEALDHAGREVSDAHREDREGTEFVERDEAPR